jgi:hypothetical protein
MYRKGDIDDCEKLCEIGDMFYKINKQGIIKMITITDIKAYPHYVYTDNEKHTYFNRGLLNSCFKTLEEAKEAIHTQNMIVEKRKLLKQYEAELNEKFNIKDHIIIK